MKQPYFQEKSLPARVEQYMDEHDYIDVEDLTEHLIDTYREFRTKSKKAFMKSVEKAYLWKKYCRERDADDSVEEISDSDGGGPDIMELSEPPPPVKAKGMNSALTNLYKSPASSPATSTPKIKDGSFYVLDTKGTHNGVSSPQKSSQKKRKKANESAIEDIVKKKKKKQLLPETPKITFAQMAGVDSLKETICDLVANLQWPGVLQPLQKSVLVTGPSGSGKTTFAMALAGTTESTLLRVMATELVGGVSGESEERISEIFEQAASLAPCVLLIEKIDVVVPKDGSGKSLERRIGTQLIACLTNLKSKYKDHKLLVVCETTKPENLDWDLRSGFDGEVFMTVPAEPARAQILKLLSEGINMDTNFEEIAYRTPGYVAGDLKKLLEKAQSLAWKRKKDALYGSTTGQSLMQQVNSFMTQFKKMCESQNINTGAALNMDDFMEALLHITPALKREGFPTVPDVTWQDIGGLQDIKKELREKILEPIRYAKLHDEFGASRPNGVLMWGPPGCGKTLLAKAVANEAGINLLPVMGPELLNMYQGESERAVREVFRRAYNVAPCVIFFDEFDSLCPIRTKGAESGSKTTIVNTLLTEMNGFSQRENVYVIAATNRPDILDPAVTRPGRFDTLLYVDVPDHPGRISILQARTKHGTCPQLAPDVDLEEVSGMCTNFSGADCDQLVYLASKEAIREVIQRSEAAATTTSTTTSSTPNPDTATTTSTATSSSSTPNPDTATTTSTTSSIPNLDTATTTSTSSTISTTENSRLVARRHFMAALEKIKPSISNEEQRRYKKLCKKMEASRVKGDVKDRFTAFKTSLITLFKDIEHSQTLSMSRVREYIESEHPSFTDGEIDAAIEKMTDANQVMLADDMLFLI